MDDKCIFCLKDNSEQQIVHIQEMKDCDCNPLVHLTCIHEWYVDAGKKCPICLKDYPMYIAVAIDQLNFLNTRLGICLTWTFTFFLVALLIALFFAILFRFKFPPAL